jgi:hypothetical protein
LASGWIAKGDAESVFAPVDKNIMNVEGVIPEAVRETVMGYFSYGGGIGWSSARNGEEDMHPTAGRNSGTSKGFGAVAASVPASRKRLSSL